MGGLTRALFGGSKSTQTSDNQAYGTLLGLLKGNIGLGNTAMGTLGSLLGIGDPAAGQAAMKNFLDSTGYKTMLDSGSQAIVNNNAVKGLFRSGDTGKRLVSFGQDLGMTKVSELIDKLTGLGNFGLQSAGTLAGAGSRSSTTSKSYNGLFPNGLSDRRTKRNIVKVAEFDDGLGLYDFEYVFAPGLVFRGVMADEVQTLRPEAMGPMVGEYLTVDYSKIGGFTDGPVLIKEVA